MARIVISGKSVPEMESDESEDEIFVGRLQKKEVLKLHVAGKKIPTVFRHPVISSPAAKSSGVEIISNNDMSEDKSSHSLVHQPDSQSQEFVTERLDKSLEEDKSKTTSYGNLTKNYNVTERSVVGGRHASLQSENVDTETMRTDGNADTNTDSLVCGKKRMSTDNMDGDNLMPAATFENATVDVQSAKTVQDDISETVEIISDNEVLEEKSLQFLVHQPDSQSQEFVTVRLEKSFEEDKSKNTSYENLTKNCNVTERSVVGGRHASLQSENVDTETMRTDGNADTNTDSLVCDKKRMSTDNSDGGNLMPVTTFEKEAVDVQSANSLQEYVSESVETILENELSEERSLNSLVYQSDTQPPEFVTGRQSSEDDKSKNTFNESLTKNCNVTERSVVGGRHASLQSENVDTETLRTNENADTNTDILVCDKKRMSTDNSDGDNLVSVAAFENAAVDAQSAKTLQDNLSESVELISDTEFNDERSSNSFVHKCDTQSQEIVTDKLEHSLEEDRSKHRFSENLAKNCNITERSVVDDRHASLQTENIDTQTINLNGNSDTNKDSVLCDKKLIPTDNSDGNNLMSVTTRENTTIDVQSANSLLSDVSENVEVSDSELSLEISFQASVDQSDTQVQEFVVGRHEQSLEEEKSNNTVFENLTKNCSVIERSIAGSRNTSLQSTNADIEAMRINGNEYFMSADRSEVDSQMSVTTLENATVNVQSANSLQADASESVEIISDSELSEEIISKSSVHESDTQLQEFVTERLEESVEEDKNECCENSMKNSNDTERSDIGGRHATLQVKNVNIEVMRANANRYTNMGTVLCDENLMSADRSDGDNQMPISTLENTTVDAQSENCLQADVSENVEVISDNELSQEISSNSSVQQSGTQLQEFVTGILDQSSEDKINSSFCENLTKDCNKTERSLAGSRHSSLQPENTNIQTTTTNGNSFTNMDSMLPDNQSSEEDKINSSFCKKLTKNCDIIESSVVDSNHISFQAENDDIETMRTIGNGYTNTDSMLCDEKLMAVDKSDGGVSIVTSDNETIDTQLVNCLQAGVTESVELISDNELLEERSSNSVVHQSDTQSQEFLTGKLKQPSEEDEKKKACCENMMKNCNSNERSIVGGRHSFFGDENVYTKTIRVNGNTHSHMDDGMLCDEKLMSADRSDGDNQISIAVCDDATVDVPPDSSLHRDVSERPELINNEELLTEASVVCAKQSSLPNGTTDITAKKYDGSTTTGVGDIHCHQVIISTDSSDNVDQITAEVCENLTLNLQSPASSNIKAFEGDCGNASIDSECLFRSEVSAIVKDINELEKFETLCCAKASCDSSTPETCVSVTRTSSGVSGTTYYSKEDSSSTDEDILENTFEMMEKLLNGFEMKPDCASKVDMDPADVNEVVMSCTPEEEMGSSNVREVEAGGMRALEVDAGSAHLCEVEAASEPAYAHAHQVELGCVRSCKAELDCIRSCKTEPDCVRIHETEPDCVHVPDVEPHCVHVPDLEPDCVHVPDSEPDCVHVPGVELDCVHVPGVELDCVHVPDEESNCVHMPDVQPDSVHMPDAQPDSVRARGAEPDSVCARGAEPDSVRARGAEPDSVRARGAEPDSVRARGAEPDSVRARGAEPDSVRARGAEPDSVRARGAEPDSVRTRGAEPDSVRARGAEPDSVRARGAEPDSVRARGAEPDSVRARGAEPDSVRARGAEPDSVRARGAEADSLLTRDAQPDSVPPSKVELKCVHDCDAEPECVHPSKDEPNCTQPSKDEPNCTQTSKDELNCTQPDKDELDYKSVIGVKPECPLEVKLNSADNLDIKAEVKSIKNILRESNGERLSLKRASGNNLYQARYSKTPKREVSTQKMPKNQILPQSAGPVRKGRLHSVKSCVKEYLNSTQPPLFANVRNRNGYGMHQKALLSPMAAKKASQECSTPKTKKIILPPVSYTSSSAAKLDISKSTSAKYVAEKCKKKIVPRSSPTVIKHAGRTVLPAKQWKPNGESEGEVSVLLASEAVRSNTLKRTRKKE